MNNRYSRCEKRKLIQGATLHIKQCKLDRHHDGDCDFGEEMDRDQDHSSRPR